MGQCGEGGVEREKSCMIENTALQLNGAVTKQNKRISTCRRPDVCPRGHRASFIDRAQFWGGTIFTISLVAGLTYMVNCRSFFRVARLFVSMGTFACGINWGGVADRSTRLTSSGCLLRGVG